MSRPDGASTQGSARIGSELTILRILRRPGGFARPRLGLPALQIFPKLRGQPLLPLFPRRLFPR